MKSYRKELWFNVPTRRAFINITPQVEECLRDSGVVADFRELMQIREADVNRLALVDDESWLSATDEHRYPC